MCITLKFYVSIRCIYYKFVSPELIQNDGINWCVFTFALCLEDKFSFSEYSNVRPIVLIVSLLNVYYFLVVC